MLFGQTATSEVVVQPDVKMVTTDQLGLGEHTVGTDGTTYTYSKGTAPKPEEVLFSDDKDGGITLRKVKTATKNPDGTVTVETLDAALSDVLQEAEVNSSLNLINLDRATADPHSVTFGVQKSSIRNDGSRVTTMQWRDDLLTIEQKEFAYQKEDYSFTPQGDNKFLMEMHPEEGAIKSAVFSIIRCIIAYLSVRVVSLKEKPKVIIRVCRPFI
ncbi:MAG: hypothetical protein D3905_13610 [Candidatus Electrothrix sp. AS4_5]|nr:hypothetical protein [Candidatus Electrothrix gigas]